MVMANKQRDDIVSPSPGSGLAGGSVSNASAGRVKSAGNAGPNFTSRGDPKKTWPVPDSPYGKDE